MKKNQHNLYVKEYEQVCIEYTQGSELKSLCLSLFELLCKEPQKFNENSLNAARHGNL